MGTQTAATTPVLDRRPHRPPRPTNPPATVRARALAASDPDSPHQAERTPTTNLTSTNRTHQTKDHPAGTVEPGQTPRPGAPQPANSQRRSRTQTAHSGQTDTSTPRKIEARPGVAESPA